MTRGLRERMDFACVLLHVPVCAQSLAWACLEARGQGLFTEPRAHRSGCSGLSNPWIYLYPQHQGTATPGLCVGGGIQLQDSMLALRIVDHHPLTRPPPNILIQNTTELFCI